MTKRQRYLLALMQSDKTGYIIHFTHDERFALKIDGEGERCEMATAYALILSGRLQCVENRSYSNIWKAK